MKLTERDKWLMWEAMKQGAFFALDWKRPPTGNHIEGEFDDWLNEQTNEEWLEAHAPNPWQPIETAPKEHGVTLWGIDNMKQQGVIFRDNSQWCWKEVLLDEHDSCPVFTHWMPLPDAPE